MVDGRRNGMEERRGEEVVLLLGEVEVDEMRGRPLAVMVVECGSQIHVGHFRASFVRLSPNSM